MKYLDVAQYYIMAHPLMFIVLGLSILVIVLMIIAAKKEEAEFKKEKGDL